MKEKDFNIFVLRVKPDNAKPDLHIKYIKYKTHKSSNIFGKMIVDEKNSCMKNVKVSTYKWNNNEYMRKLSKFMLVII